MTPFACRAFDFCSFEELDLPLYRQGLVLVAGDNRDTDAASSNGSGKSTLLKAPTWCLTGKSPDGARAQDLVRRGQKDMLTEVDLVDDHGVVWTVRRGRRSGRPFAEVHDAETGDLVAKGEEAVSGWVERAIGMDHAAWCAAVLYGADEGPRFGSPYAKDSQRKAVLHRILGTARFEALAKWASARAREMESLAREARGRCSEAAAAIEALPNFGDLAGEWEGKRRARIADLEKRRSDEDVEELKAERDRLITLSVEGDEAYRARQEALEEYGDMRHRLDMLESEVRSFDRQIKECEAQLEAFNEGRCPTCSTPSDSDSVIKKVEEIRGRRVDLIDRSRAASLQREKLEKDINKMDGGSGTVRPDLLAKIKEGEDAEPRIERLTARIDLLESIDTKIANILDEENPFTEKIDEATKKIRKLRKRADKLGTLAKLREQEAIHAQFWSRGFGPRGLPSMLFDDAMAPLTESANDALRVLADGDINVEFSTLRELKSKTGKRDEVTLTWEVEGVPGAPPSRGQRKKMEIAGDLALMELAVARLPDAPDLLMMDEALDGLDTHGRARVVELLRGMRSRRSSVFVVTHEPFMAEVFECVFTVVKEHGVSRLVKM